MLFWKTKVGAGGTQEKLDRTRKIRDIWIWIHIEANEMEIDDWMAESNKDNGKHMNEVQSYVNVSSKIHTHGIV